MTTNGSARLLGSGTGRIDHTGRASSTHYGTSIADHLLDRLDGVRLTSPGQWMARCPAHDDRDPSLSIRDAGDRILLNCFAGCSPEAVVGALGLRMADLFVGPSIGVGRHGRASRQCQFSRRDMEAALQHELLVLLQVVGNRVSSRQLRRDKNIRILRPEWTPMPEGFWDRELQAARRVRHMLSMLYGPDLDGRRTS